MQRVIERILNLLAFLLTADRPVTANEIRRTVAGYDQDSDTAWHRMFERDKDLLRQLGIPLVVQATDAFEVEHGYTVDRTQAEIADPDLTEGIFKLGGVPLTSSGEPLAADLGRDQEVVADAFAAIASRTELAMVYNGRERVVAGYGLVHRRGRWYLVAEDRGDDTLKVFRIDRTSKLAPVGEPEAYERPRDLRPADVIPEAAWEAGGDDLTAVVTFDPSIAWWARRQLAGNTETVEGSDGGLTATMRVANQARSGLVKK